MVYLLPQKDYAVLRNLERLTLFSDALDLKNNDLDF